MRTFNRNNMSLTVVASGIVTAALATAAAYLFDPQSGRRRRALIRDQLIGRSRSTRDFLRKAQRDAVERTRGLFAASRARIHPAPRMAVGVGGATMLLTGLMSKSVAGTLLAIVGTALLVRSASNRPWSQLINVRSQDEQQHHRTRDQKTMPIYADRDEAYAGWGEYRTH